MELKQAKDIYSKIKGNKCWEDQVVAISYSDIPYREMEKSMNEVCEIWLKSKLEEELKSKIESMEKMVYDNYDFYAIGYNEALEDVLKELKNPTNANTESTLFS